MANGALVKTALLSTLFLCCFGLSVYSQMEVNPNILDSSAWPMRGRDKFHTGRGYSEYSVLNTVKWGYQTSGTLTSSSAVGHDGTVYFGSGDNYIYALNDDGTLKWRYQTGGGVNTTPAVTIASTVYAGSQDKYLYAINYNGTLKWRFMTGDSIESSPAIGPEGVVYVGSQDYYLYAINPNGTFKWRYRDRRLYSFLSGNR